MAASTRRTFLRVITSGRRAGCLAIFFVACFVLFLLMSKQLAFFKSEWYINCNSLEVHDRHLLGERVRRYTNATITEILYAYAVHGVIRPHSGGWLAITMEGYEPYHTSTISNPETVKALARLLVITTKWP